MKLEDIYIANVKGGIFYDELTSVTSESEWGSLCEEIRPVVKEVLTGIGVHEKLQVKVKANGFQYQYTINNIDHKIVVTKDTITFEHGQFKGDQEPSKVIGIVMEKILQKINREDWNTIGTMFRFAIPLKAAENASFGADALQKYFLNPNEESLRNIFPTGNLQIVDLSLTGKIDNYDVEWKIWNVEKQHIGLSFDMQIKHNQVETEGVHSFIIRVFSFFKDKCGPLIE
ncbi:MAG: hypothetical protein WAK60_09485, partial [Sedimentisphaerales bacterium]